MAKAIGLIGNYTGKLGNTVGYNLKDSNNKQTQGVRVYQPVVKNPKTSAQAEQRAKLAPINATYRALKLVIDRGQQGKAYGNKSRLAWLKVAILSFIGAWYDKSAVIGMPALVQLTKGTLPFSQAIDATKQNIQFALAGVTAAGTTTIGALATAFINAFPGIKSGDQLTFVITQKVNDRISATIESLVLDTTSTAAIPSFLTVGAGTITAFSSVTNGTAAAIILSREGSNGEHLRSSVTLQKLASYDNTKLADAAKNSAIASYMAAGSNTDWAEESIM